MAYTYDQIEARDPSNPNVVAANAAVTIFAPGDPQQTPLAIKSTSGMPLPNPITVNNMGYGDAFIHETLGRVAWSGGGFTGFFTAHDSIMQEAVAARIAAEAAAQAAIEAAQNGGGGGGGGGVNNGNYWNRTQTAPVITIGATAPWPTSAPEGAVIIRLSGGTGA